MAADGSVKIIIQADGKQAIGSVDQLVSRLDDIGGAGQKAGSILKSVLGANLISHALISGLGIIKNGIVGMVSDLSSASATWKTFNANMKNIGMPDSEIAKTRSELQKFAQDTIYSSADMATTFSQLAAVGTKNTTQLITGFGGLAAAAEDPTQAMKTLSQQATQMAAKPKVQWEDFKLMLEQTPAGMAAVAKAMGKSTSQLIKDIQAGTIKTSDFFNAVNRAGNAPGFQKMATQYKTVGQAVDGLRETLTNKLLVAFDKVNNKAIDSVSKLVDLVGAMDFSGVANATVAAMTAVADAITFVVKHADQLKTAAVAIGTFFAVFKGVPAIIASMKAMSNAMEVGKLLVSVASGSKYAADGLKLMANQSKIAAVASSALDAVLNMNPFVLIAAAIAAVAAGLVYFFTQTKTGQAYWAKFVAWIKQAGPALAAVGASIKQVLAAGLQKLAPVFAAVGDAVGRIAPFFKSAASAISSFVSAGLQNVAGWFTQLTASVSGVASSGLGKIGGWFSQLASSIGRVVGSGLAQVGPLLDHMGGAFGKLGVLLGPAISLITKLALAALKISGPWSIAISVITAFLGMWAKTGSLNADGITQVFTNLTSTITGTANMISQYLPQFITMGTDLLVSLINGITAALPQITTAAVSIITGLANALSAALPAIITAGTDILTMLVQAIVTALPGLVNAGVQIITGLLHALISALPVLVSAGTQIITGLLNAIITALPALIGAGIQILTVLVQAIVTMLPMLINAALQIIMALVNGLIVALPQIIAAGIQILMALINGIIQILPELVSAALQIIMALVNALISALPQIIEAGIQILMALINGIISILPALIDAALQLIMALVGALIDNLPKLIDAGIKLITALISGLIKVIPQLIAAALQIIVALFQALISNAPKILSAGVQLIKALISGLLQLLGQLGSAALKLGAKVVDSIKGKAKSMVSAGVDFVKGFINGIGSMIGNVVKTAEDLGSKAVDAVKKFLHIGSPSKVMRRMGVWTGEGFRNGIKEMLPQVAAMSDKMAAAATVDVPDVSLGSVTGAAYAGRYTRAEQLVGGFGRILPSSQTVNNYTSNISNSADGRVVEVHVSANIDGKPLAKQIAEPVRVELNRIDRQNRRRKGFY